MRLTGDPEQEYFVDGVTGEPYYRSITHLRFVRDSAQHGLYLQGQTLRREADRAGA
jgi:hypothetical protein